MTKGPGLPEKPMKNPTSNAASRGRGSAADKAAGDNDLSTPAYPGTVAAAVIRVLRSHRLRPAGNRTGPLVQT